MGVVFFDLWVWCVVRTVVCGLHTTAQCGCSWSLAHSALHLTWKLSNKYPNLTTKHTFFYYCGVERLVEERQNFGIWSILYEKKVFLSDQGLLVLKGRGIAKNFVTHFKKRGLRLQNGSNLFFNISDNFYLLKLWSAKLFEWTNKNSQKLPNTTIFLCKK